MNSHQEKWIQLWRDAGADGDAIPWFDRLTRFYAEPHRHYHNFRHIDECLQEFAPVRSLAREPIAVETAIWFHDAIYNPRASDNEEQSAALAGECLSGAGVSESFVQTVVQLILATKSHDVSVAADAPLLVDVDLSILGKPEARFWEYESQIRQEFAWVPGFVFGGKRAEILERFLARPRIYSTELFREKYEAQARVNLQSSIRKLRLKTP